MAGDRQHTGRFGEDIAARYLEKRGCRVVARNYRCPVGELDLVVEGPDGLIFVEVRTKSQPVMLHPEETITRSKALHLLRSAEWYLAATEQGDRPWRVDLIAVELSPAGKPVRVERIPDATSGFVDYGH